MKGVLIVQPKDWTPAGGPEGVVETLYETFTEAETAYNATDSDINWVTLWQCNDVWYDRRQISTNIGG
jgi:hypothetical protein